MFINKFAANSFSINIAQDFAMSSHFPLIIFVLNEMYEIGKHNTDITFNQSVCLSVILENLVGRE